MARIMFGCIKPVICRVAIASSANMAHFCLRNEHSKSRQRIVDLLRRLMVERTGATKIEIHSPTWLSEFKIHLPFGRSVSRRAGLCGR